MYNFDEIIENPYKNFMKFEIKGKKIMKVIPGKRHPIQKGCVGIIILNESEDIDKLRKPIH